jgi:Subtilisin inhibitor-like
MIYQPVTAKATGTWRGQPIDFSQTYPNRCTLESETGSVFKF